MSKMLVISATRQVRAVNQAGREVVNQITKKFRAVAAPPTQVDSIAGAQSQTVAYVNYVRSLSQPQLIPVFTQRPGPQPERYKEFDWTQVHIDQFQDWVQTMTQEGYVINFESVRHSQPPLGPRQ